MKRKTQVDGWNESPYQPPRKKTYTNNDWMKDHEYIDVDAIMLDKTTDSLPNVIITEVDDESTLSSLGSNDKRSIDLDYKPEIEDMDYLDIDDYDNTTYSSFDECPERMLLGDLIDWINHKEKEIEKAYRKRRLLNNLEEIKTRRSKECDLPLGEEWDCDCEKHKAYEYIKSPVDFIVEEQSIPNTPIDLDESQVIDFKKKYDDYNRKSNK